MDRIRIRLTSKYILALCALTFLCGLSHEFVHHFVGAAICGGFGTKTFNSFTLAPGCDGTLKGLWATAAGPVFTFALMWMGARMLGSTDRNKRYIGFALIFANFPINRMLFVLLNSNDEQYIARSLYGDARGPFWVASIIVWLFCIPPLIAAFKAIENRRRVLWFAGFFFLPFAFVIFAGVFLEHYLLQKKHFLATPVIGIPLLILLAEVVSGVLYARYKAALTAPPIDVGA